MQNTLAQDLAWERWEKCRVGGINMTHITPDGRIWVTYTADHGAALREWQECDRRMATEQGRRRATTSPPPPATTGGGTAARAPIQLPVWKVGTEWAYRYENPASAGTFVWSVDRVESLDGQQHYVIKTGTREIFYRVADLGFTKETVDGNVVRQVTPSDWRFVAFPLTAGTSRDMKYHEVRPPARETEDVERRCTAEAEETLTVPAGTFATVRVSCRNSRNGAWLATIWYSGQVGHMVREEASVTGGKRVRELISYRLR